jgi:hypothetical protein
VAVQATPNSKLETEPKHVKQSPRQNWVRNYLYLVLLLLT